MTSYTYDSLNRLATVTENGVTASYAYDTNGNRSSVEYGNGLREEYSYNAGNMLTGLTNKSETGEVLSSYTYTYTLDGNQSTKMESDGRTTTYHYDGLGRLASEEETLVGQLLHKAAYTYDDFGNRSSMTVTGLEAYSVAYAYDMNNRLLTETQSAGSESVTTSYTYDASGNQLTKTSSGTLAVGESMVYNGNGQLSAVTVGTETTSYSYWPSGLRLSKSTGDAVNTFIWDGANLVYESGSGTKYIRGTSLIASLDDGTATYYLYNGHGDVVQLADSTGAVTKTYRYDAFGVERDPDEADANPFRYCGEYYDRETGAYYLRARNYAPGLGRFSQEDPVRSSLYRYVYCANNPVMFIDPTGCVIEVVGIEESKSMILVNLQALTDHTLALTEDGKVYIAEYAKENYQFESGNTLIKRMIASDYTTTIVRGYGDTTNKTLYLDDVTYENSSDSIVIFNPNLIISVWTQVDGEDYAELKERSPYIGLAHELIHADRAMRGVVNFDLNHGTSFPIQNGYKDENGVNLEEYFTVGIVPNRDDESIITENMIRAEHGLGERMGYRVP